MFSAASFSTGAFSPAAWLFDEQPAVAPQAPKPSGGGTAGQRARAWRRTQDFNQNLLSVVAVIVASGILEGSDP